MEQVHILQGDPSTRTLEADFRGQFNLSFSIIPEVNNNKNPNAFLSLAEEMRQL